MEFLDVSDFPIFDFGCQKNKNGHPPALGRRTVIPRIQLAFPFHSRTQPPPLPRTALPFVHSPLSRESPGLTKWVRGFFFALCNYFLATFPPVVNCKTEMECPTHPYHAWFWWIYVTWAFPKSYGGSCFFSKNLDPPGKTSFLVLFVRAACNFRPARS